MGNRHHIISCTNNNQHHFNPFGSLTDHGPLDTHWNSMNFKVVRRGESKTEIVPNQRVDQTMSTQIIRLYWWCSIYWLATAHVTMIWCNTIADECMITCWCAKYIIRHTMVAVWNGQKSCVIQHKIVWPAKNCSLYGSGVNNDIISRGHPMAHFILFCSAIVYR